MPRPPPRARPRPANGLRLARPSSHFTARLGRRTASARTTTLASAVEQPAARTFRSFHRSPRPANGLSSHYHARLGRRTACGSHFSIISPLASAGGRPQLALPSPRLAVLEDPHAVGAQAAPLGFRHAALGRPGQGLVGEIERPQANADVLEDAVIRGVAGEVEAPGARDRPATPEPPVAIPQRPSGEVLGGHAGERQAT